MIILPILLAVGFHLAGPAIGAWLASMGLLGTPALIVTQAGEWVFGKAVTAVVKAIPHGPLTPAEKVIVERDRAQSRQDAFGPFG